MDDLIEWYENTYDPDEIVDILDLSVEDLVRAFLTKAEEHYGEVSEIEEEALLG